MAEKAAQQTALTEHVPNAEHGGGFPPFQKDTFASQIVWLALTFVALYLLMSRVALPRIAAIFEDRRQRIDGDLAQAQRLKDSSEAALAAYEKSLADARNRAQTRRANARRPQPKPPAKISTPSSTPRSPRPRRRSPIAGRRPWPTCRG